MRAREIGTKAVTDTSLDGTKGEVVAVVATLDQVDHDHDVILSGAIPDGTRVTVSAYNHDTVLGQMRRTPMADAPPVGKGTIRIDGKRAIAHMNYFMKTQRGREAFLTVEAMGADQPWSFAYTEDQVDPAAGEWKAKGARRVLSKLGPLLDGAMEVSPVKMPGGKGTYTIAARCEGCGSDRISSCGCGGHKSEAVPAPGPADLTAWICSNYRSERAALIALREGCKRWGIREAPAVRWFRGPVQGKVGQYLGDRAEIWLDSTLNPHDASETLLHELRHAVQAERGEPILGDARAEGEAEGYARYLVRCLREEGILE